MTQDRKMIMRNIVTLDRAAGIKHDLFTRNLNRAIATMYQQFSELPISEVVKKNEEEGTIFECNDGLISNSCLESPEV